VMSPSLGKDSGNPPPAFAMIGAIARIHLNIHGVGVSFVEESLVGETHDRTIHQISDRFNRTSGRAYQ
jgi:hypothetical protein